MADSTRTTVLAISRQLGSGGATIGQSVAKLLSLKYADRDVLHQAALKLNLEDADVAPLEEHVDSFWEHLAPLFLFGVTGGPMPVPLPPPISGPVVFQVETEIITNLAERENAVIVGRGAAHVLRGRPGLISVFLHAPEDVRVERLQERLEESDRGHALDIVRRSDRQRAEFNKAITGCDWKDATQYDLTINTGTVGIDRTTQLIAELVVERLDAMTPREP
jgi:cytidylate kinase